MTSKCEVSTYFRRQKLIDALGSHVSVTKLSLLVFLTSDFILLGTRIHTVFIMT